MRYWLKIMFWNATQLRLRTAWRLVLQTGLMVAAGVFLTTLFNLVMLSVVAVRTISTNIGKEPVELERSMNELLSSGGGRMVTSLMSVMTVGIAVHLAGRWLDRRKFGNFGFHLSRKWWLDLVFGFGLAGVLMGLVFAVEAALGWVHVIGYWQSTGSPFLLEIGVAFFAFICVGIYEEMLFRAYHLRNFAEGLNFRWIGPRWALVSALFLSSAVFSLSHLANPNFSWFGIFNIFLSGFLLGVGFLLTGEMAIPIGLHIGWNFFQGNVFGFPVSGTDAGASVITIQQGGVNLLTGGNFGPEGGLVGLVAILLGLAVVFGWVRFTRQEVSLQRRLAIYHRDSGKLALDNPEEMSIIRQNRTLKDFDEGK
jgi:hypothetical protein